MQSDQSTLDRRFFLKSTAAGIGTAAIGAGLLHGEEKSEGNDKPVEVNEKDLIWRNKVPTMEYARLGRTNYMCSRIVQGFAGDETLWRRLLSKGLNYFDTAWGYGEGNSEKNLKPFVTKFRDKVWVTSKATGVAGYNKVDEELIKLYRKAMTDFIQKGDAKEDLLALHKEAVKKEQETGEKPDLRACGKRIAELYASKLDESLQRLGIEQVDCYFLHGVEIPWIFDCIEMWETYEKAHKAGKVKHFGFSTHKHQKEVLAAAVVANNKGPWKIDLIMPGINPETIDPTNVPVKAGLSFDYVKPELEALKKQDVGIVAMKTKGIAGRPVDGREKKFTSMMEGKEYNEWERAKLWMLHLTEGLVDACIAGTENNDQMERNMALPAVKLTAEAKRELRALVKLEMAGACHLCGNCETNCPEHIAVTDMIRYHSYIHQYNEKDLTRKLYAQAGYDPSKVCTNCGKCADSCNAGVPITQILHQLSAEMAMG